jgi:hypothetical protein
MEADREPEFAYPGCQPASCPGGPAPDRVSAAPPPGGAGGADCAICLRRGGRTDHRLARSRRCRDSAAAFQQHGPRGLALVAVVALPATTLAWLAACGHRRTADTSIVAGILLAGWILVELAFIRELSFFQPVYFVLGILLIWAGATTRRHEAGHSKADDEHAA